MLGQGDRFLQRDEHIDHAMLQYLKRSERDPELLARLGVFKGCGIQLGHRADGFGAKRGDGAVAASLQNSNTLAFLAQDAAGRDPYALQSDFRGAPAVNRLEALQVKVGGLPVYDEKADPVAVARTARRPRRDNQFVGPWRASHGCFCAAQDIFIPMTLRDRSDTAKIVAGASLRPGEGPNRFAGRYLRQKLLALRARSGLLDQPAREHNCLEERLDHESAAKLLHDDHARQRARAETAKIFRERCRQQAKFGESIPMLSAPALFARNDLAARVEVVLIAEQPLKAIAQQLLFICKLNVHLAPRCEPFTNQALLLR